MEYGFTGTSIRRAAACARTSDYARETREEDENDMKTAIAIVTKLSAAMVAALLLTPLLTGAPPQGPLNPRAGTIKSEMQTNRSDHLGPARDKYRFQDINVEEAQSYTAIFDINNWGLAVGDYVDAANNFNAFLWRNGDRKPLAGWRRPLPFTVCDLA